MNGRFYLKDYNLALARKHGRRLTRAVPALRYAGGELRFHRIVLDFSPPGIVVNPHKHGFYEAVLILRGRGRETAPPHKQLRPGVWQLHPPHTLHGWAAAGASSLLRFGAWFDVNPPAPLRVLEKWLICPPREPEVLNVLNEMQTERPGRRERVAARLTLLLAPVLNLLEWPASAGEDADYAESEKSIIAIVDQFLADNIAQPISLQDVAIQMHMSVPTLNRRVRVETGDSVMKRLYSLRMCRAAELLQEGAASVKEIGPRIGIPEPSYFCRCFRRYFGQSPSRWRGQSRK